MANSSYKMPGRAVLYVCLRNPDLFFMGVPSLFCSSQGLSCNCLFKDNNKGRLSEELCTAISSLEASTATTAQCDGGVESSGKEGEERRKREADWVVIKGLFFLPTGEHLHSSHLLRGDVHARSHSHVQLAPFFLKGWPLPPAPLPHADP